MELLTEKYRPTKIEDIVNPTGDNNDFIKKLQYWKETGKIDTHLLFFGPAGTGKSSTVRVILNELGITDTLIINGSDKTGIDDTRKLMDYASIPPFNDGIKIVVIEEFERMSPQAQDSLKYVLETYSGWCRFILTTNNIAKVTTPIISRCELYNFKELNRAEFVQKIVSILTNEQIEYGMDDIANFIKTSYPDLRKCINLISKNVIEENGKKKLTPFNVAETVANDKFNDVLKYFKTGNIIETRQVIINSIGDEEYESFYNYMSLNLGLITDDDSKFPHLLVKIAEYLYRTTMGVAYKDLQLASCLIEMREVLNNK